MKKEKLIQEINHALDSATAHIKRIREQNNDVHRIDIDLLLGETRNIYDMLIRLDTLIVPFEMELPEQSRPIEEDSKTPQPKIIEEEKQENVKMEEEKIMSEEVVEESFVFEETANEELAPEQLKQEKKPELAKREPHEDSPEKEPEMKSDTGEKTTIDLFSTAQPTIGDVYSEQETSTLADKFTEKGVNGLREAIGINEKFLFINELFNGDMSRYNKVIDELDEFQTLKGTETYLLELKVQNQWANDNPALIKLLELLKRKFTS